LFWNLYIYIFKLINLKLFFLYIKKINAGYNFYRNREYNQKFELLLLIDVDKLCLTTIKLNSENNL